MDQLLCQIWIAHIRGICGEVNRIFKDRTVGQGRGQYTAAQLVLQRTAQVVAGHPTQDASDELRLDPGFGAMLGACASQPTMSRLFTSTTDEDVDLMRTCARAARKPKRVVLDIDTTHVPTRGRQEGAGFIGHCQAVGFHPVLAYDHDTGYVVGGELRPGGQYCSKDTDKFLARTLQELLEDLRAAGVEDVSLRLRGDSGFAAPDIYKVLEEFGVSYMIRLKNNSALDRLSWDVRRAVSGNSDWTHDIEGRGEFMCQAGSWDRKRRVIGVATRKAGRMGLDMACLAASMEENPEEVLFRYRGRGDAENSIKETKESFVISLPHRGFECNSFLFQFGLFAQLLLGIFRTTCLGPTLAGARAATIQSRLFRIEARVSRSGRRVHFRMNSSWRHKEEYEEAWRRCGRAAPDPRAFRRPLSQAGPSRVSGPVPHARFPARDPKRTGNGAFRPLPQPSTRAIRGQAQAVSGHLVVST